MTEVQADTPQTEVEDTDICFLGQVEMGFGSIQLGIPLILRLPLFCMLLPIVIDTNTEARDTWEVPWNPIKHCGKKIIILVADPLDDSPWTVENLIYGRSIHIVPLVITSRFGVSHISLKIYLIIN